MKIAKMNVRLCWFCPRDEFRKAYIAARMCYSSKDIRGLYYEVSHKAPTDIHEFVLNRMREGHMTIAEHIHMTFAIEGISRACSHQLVRHRLAVYSQRSQRYCEPGELEIVVPPSIAPIMLTTYMEGLRFMANAYESLESNNVAREDARFVLPNATSTSLVMTINLRELIHICHERLCNRAQWEIRGLVQKMRKCVVDREPNLAEFLTPKCDVYGYCREAKSCGRNPKLRTSHD